MNLNSRHRRSALLWMLAAGFVLGEAIPPVALRIETPAGAKTISADALRKQIKPAKVKVYNPSYKRVITYQGFWFEDVLNAANFPKGPDVIILCQDGYSALLPAASIGKHQWLLAYGEDSGHWTSLDQGGAQVSPAPWYLIGKTKESFGDFPWPYRIVTVRSLQGW